MKEEEKTNQSTQNDRESKQPLSDIKQNSTDPWATSQLNDRPDMGYRAFERNERSSNNDTWGIP